MPHPFGARAAAGRGMEHQIENPAADLWHRRFAIGDAVRIDVRPMSEIVPFGQRAYHTPRMPVPGY
jgi:hypothetical protein